MPEYGATTAEHYAAWRPPLHRQILAKAFGEDERFKHGLDVGCGTGHSARALAEYCDKVTGTDPSPEMLAWATPTDQLKFVAQDSLSCTGIKPFTPKSFDVFTFAGSLNYQDPGHTFKEVRKLATADATIITYDFEIKLEEVFHALFRQQPPGSNYNHQKNFAAVENAGFRGLLHHEERLYCSASPAEVAHLLGVDVYFSRYDL